MSEQGLGKGNLDRWILSSARSFHLSGRASQMLTTGSFASMLERCPSIVSIKLRGVRCNVLPAIQDFPFEHLEVLRLD